MLAGGGQGGQEMGIFLRHILAFKACRGAIKFGDPLSQALSECFHAMQLNETLLGASEGADAEADSRTGFVQVPISAQPLVWLCYLALRSFKLDPG